MRWPEHPSHPAPEQPRRRAPVMLEEDPDVGPLADVAGCAAAVLIAACCLAAGLVVALVLAIR